MRLFHEKKKKAEEWSSEQQKAFLDRMKTRLLMKFPFYGEILLRIPIEEDAGIRTAATNGRVIKYNAEYMKSLSDEKKQFVFLHELLHILLLHWNRGADRNPICWNIAADYVVNGILKGLINRFGYEGITIAMPEQGLYCKEYADMSVEKVYEIILQNAVIREEEYFLAEDLSVLPELSEAEKNAWRVRLRQIIDAAMKKWNGKGCEILPEIMQLVRSRRLDWKRLLRDHLSEQEYEEVSYQTPERKYLHMDLILPGAGRETEERIAEIWAFIDCSGSVETQTIYQFITQLYRIAEEFHTTVNLAYWHVRVSDVYRGIKDKEQLISSCPHERGGTNPSCIYEYLEENKIDPKAMLILTDGCFRSPERSITGKYEKKTIVVLEEGSMSVPEGMGKLARL